MERIQIGQVVERLSSGKKGVTVNNFMSCCTPDETPVVYDGSDSFAGTITTDLKVIGLYEAPDAGKKCGLGKGAKCCKYLTFGPKGFTCDRFSNIRMDIFFKSDMVSKGSPLSLYPACQDEIQRAIDEEESVAV